MKQNCIFRLTDSERDTLGCALEKISYDPHGGMGYVIDVRIAALTSMPRRVIDALNEQRASITPRPYLLFENLPVDTQVFTAPDPQVFSPSAKTGYISENLAMAFATLIGEPYSIMFEGADIVNNLIPTVADKKAYTGLGSEVELDFHIENAALKFMGDFNFSPLGLLLTGVRHDLNGPLTRLSDSRAALAKMSQDDIDCLRQASYRIKVPYRWRRNPIDDNSQQTSLVPLLRGSVDLPEVSAVFYPDMVEAQSDRAALAMKNFHAAIREVSFGIDIKPGRLVYIDNRITLHSRDKFVATMGDDGRPLRWIQRVFVAPNLWNHRHLSSVKSRVFEPMELAA